MDTLGGSLTEGRGGTLSSEGPRSDQGRVGDPRPGGRRVPPLGGHRRLDGRRFRAVRRPQTSPKVAEATLAALGGLAGGRVWVGFPGLDLAGVAGVWGRARDAQRFWLPLIAQ